MAGSTCIASLCLDIYSETVQQRLTAHAIVCAKNVNPIVTARPQLHLWYFSAGMVAVLDRMHCTVVCASLNRADLLCAAITMYLWFLLAGLLDRI